MKYSVPWNESVCNENNRFALKIMPNYYNYNSCCCNLKNANGLYIVQFKINWKIAANHTAIQAMRIQSLVDVLKIYSMHWRVVFFFENQSNWNTPTNIHRNTHQVNDALLFITQYLRMFLMIANKGTSKWTRTFILDRSISAYYLVTWWLQRPSS